MADITTAPEIKGAKWNAFTNGRYHADREAFLSFWDRAITFALLCAGTSVIVSSTPEYVKTFSAVALTIFALAQLVFELSRTAQRHSYLRDSYFKVASDVERGSISPNEAQARMLELAGTEDPIYCTAHLLAEQWAYEAVYGRPQKKAKKIRFLRKLTRHYLRHANL